MNKRHLEKQSSMVVVVVSFEEEEEEEKRRVSVLLADDVFQSGHVALKFRAICITKEFATVRVR